MKKICCTLLAVLVLLGCFAVGAGAAEDVVYISDLPIASYYVAEEKAPFIDETEYGENLTIAGVAYDKGITMHPDNMEDAYVEYDISAYSSEYEWFYCVVGKDACTAPAPETVTEAYVVVDGEDAGYSDLLAYGSSYVFIINIKNAKTLQLITTNGGDGMAWDTTSWADAKLCNLEVRNVEIASPMTKTEYNVGDTLDTKGGYLQVTFSDDSSAQVAINSDMVSGFDSSAEGTCVLTISYAGQTVTMDVTIHAASTQAPTATPAEKTPAKTTENSTPKATASMATQGAAGVENTDNTLVYIIVVVAVVVIAAVVAIVIILKKKKK